MDRSNIEKIAQDPEDRFLLAKLYDKIQTGIRRNIPVDTCFLSPRELELCRYLFGETEGLHSFGGWEGAERRKLCYLPDYLDPSCLWEEDGPIVCLHGTFFEGDDLSHRDILGSLMGAGIRRDTVGDIFVGKGTCDILVSATIAPYLLEGYTGAGRTKIHFSVLPLSRLEPPQAQVKEIRDTVASLRLDSIISSGFRVSRGIATQHIAAGRAAIDGLPCQKADKPVEQGSKISVRGLGKILLYSVNGQTKKGRISVVIHRYV